MALVSGVTLVVVFATTMAWPLDETWVTLSGGVSVTDNVAGPAELSPRRRQKAERQHVASIEEFRYSSN